MKAATRAELPTEVAKMPVDEFNRRLKKLRKRARKARSGDGGAKAREARRRVKKLRRLGLGLSCCGKSLAKHCRCCPRGAPELVLTPLKAKL